MARRRRSAQRQGRKLTLPISTRSSSKSTQSQSLLLSICLIAAVWCNCPLQHWYLQQGHVDLELFRQRHLWAHRDWSFQARFLQQEVDHLISRNPNCRSPDLAWWTIQARHLGRNQGCNQVFELQVGSPMLVLLGGWDRGIVCTSCYIFFRAFLLPIVLHYCSCSSEIVVLGLHFHISKLINLIMNSGVRCPDQYRYRCNTSIPTDIGYWEPVKESRYL